MQVGHINIQDVDEGEVSSSSTTDSEVAEWPSNDYTMKVGNSLVAEPMQR